jgi:hypothetical protein
MDITEIRVLALSGLFALGTAVVIALVIIFFSGERSFRLTHLPLLITLVAFLTMTAFCLAISIKDRGFVSRAELAPYIALFEFGAFFAGWAWFWYSVRTTFCIKRHHHTEAGC